MERASLSRKPMKLMLLALGAMLVGGCASHYPYYGGDGVYYGKSYDRHGYYQPYGYSSYSYDYYRYDRGYRYRPYRYGYYGGYYSHRHHDRDRVRHDPDDGSGIAADELRRNTRETRSGGFSFPGNDARRIRHQKSEPARDHGSPGGSDSRAQLRQQQRRTPAPSRPAPRPSPGTDDNTSRHDGGIRTPRDRL